ncbi:MAG: hypothetical protein ABR561_00570 [Guyparkeria sp.]
MLKDQVADLDVIIYVAHGAKKTGYRTNMRALRAHLAKDLANVEISLLDSDGKIHGDDRCPAGYFRQTITARSRCAKVDSPQDALARTPSNRRSGNHHTLMPH